MPLLLGLAGRQELRHSALRARQGRGLGHLCQALDLKHLGRFKHLCQKMLRLTWRQCYTRHDVHNLQVDTYFVLLYATFQPFGT